ncbi:electron transfer flavoprotein subunit alpha/FixB family protein [Sporomusa sp.]|uniref:electron transfer flavoprotein subunit alpha/FixB family protein n=1 Tax=Sporomusa sp. TaxID=2078658 RepID=UPI002B6CF932|nr:electron transfer flavoprotein subunit alpha/FixB family protein [Sporomusa sp.]HWR07478.1 electron transfer flavoprotein subunit alpha/FixB family protein [Sporomusa sp.]
MNNWIIIIDERRAGGMLDAARRLGGQVLAAVVGPRALAEDMAKLGFDRVLCFETAEGVPAEAYAAQVADAAKAAEPRLVLASDAPISRTLLGAAAVKLNAALIGTVRALAVNGERIVVSRSAAEGKVLEDVEVQGPLAVIFDGEDIEVSSAQPAPVELIPVGEPGAMLRLVETSESGAESAGMLTAARVVGVGMGLRFREDLKLIEELADAMHAEIACTLPVCDDMRWFPAHRVVGSSHNQIAPDLYIAVGISGQPQHTSGIRDAKVVVAVNNDPEAGIFKKCDYGILGDLYKVVPALVSAFKNIG